MWKLSIEDDQGQSTIVQLVRGEYSIGRTEENTIRLTERNISRHHAKLRKQGPAWFLEDLGSYNGCFVNGGRVVEHQPVHPNDLIQLGDYRLELHADEAEALAATQASPPRITDTLSTTLNLSAQTDRLVMVVGPTPGREFMLVPAPQRIGRGEECEICVNHSSVSRWHADLNSVGSGRYEVVDHNSSNGIRINGVDLARGILDARDLLELGDIVLKFIPSGQVYRPSPDESRQLAVLLGVDADGPPPSKLDRLGFIWKSMSRATRWGTVVLGVVVAVLFAFVTLSRNEHAAQLASRERDAIDANQTTLILARKQFEVGKLSAAHEILQTIGDAAPERRDPIYRKIEQAFADDVFARAEKAATTPERKTLLESLMQSTSLDSATRSRAADLLTKLGNDAAVEPATAVEPSATASPEQPTPSSPPVEATVNAEPAPPPTRTAPNTGTPTTRRPLVAAKANAPSDSYTAPVARTGMATASVVSTSSGQTGSGQKGAASPATPQEPSAADLATSGNIESAKAARDALKRKVTAGTAKESEKRLLRALCRQLGDSSCSR